MGKLLPVVPFDHQYRGDEMSPWPLSEKILNDLSYMVHTFSNPEQITVP
jgi:hypothetical protein